MYQPFAAISKSIMTYVPSLSCSFYIFTGLQGIYRRWAKDNNFESRLAGDVKIRKAAVVATPPPNQSSLDKHLAEKPQPERVTPYLDASFRDAAIEWLIATDQVCSMITLFDLSITWLHPHSLASRRSQTSEVQGDDQHCSPCD